jgi:hypothetical protein
MIVKFQEWECQVHFGEYAEGGRTSIQLFSEEEGEGRMNIKYKMIEMCKNLHGHEYERVATYSDGQHVLFSTRDDAERRGELAKQTPHNGVHDYKIEAGEA